MIPQRYFSYTEIYHSRERSKYRFAKISQVCFSSILIQENENPEDPSSCIKIELKIDEKINMY